MKRIKNIFISQLILFCITNFTNNYAQNSDSTRLPSLGDHVFTTIAGMSDPFIKTKFILTIGIANLVNTEIPIYIKSRDETVIFEPNIFYTVGGIEYQHAVKDWAAIHFKAGGLARVGDDVLSIAAQGISAASFFGIGMLFKLAESENLLLSGSMDLNTSSLTYIDFSSKFDDIDVDSLTSQQVINNYQILSGNLQFRLALKFSRVLGLIANASGSVGEIYARDSKNDFNWVFGSLLNVDMKNWINIPFGVAFGGTVVSNDWQYNTTSEPVYTVNLNISFINQGDFMVGLENYLQLVDQDRFDKTYKFHYSRIYLSYFF